MGQKPPPPVVQSFLICREIFRDSLTGQYVLLNPCGRFFVLGFPVVLRLAIFLQIKEGRGSYQLALRLRDMEGQLLGEKPAAEPALLHDPLAYFEFSWRDVDIQVGHPGKYDLTLVANGEELATHALEIVHQLPR